MRSPEMKNPAGRRGSSEHNGWQAEATNTFRVAQMINQQGNTGIPADHLQAAKGAFGRVSIDQVSDAEFLAQVAEAFAGEELGRCVLEGPDGVSFQVCGAAKPLIEQLTEWTGPSDQDGIEVHFCDVGRRGRAYPLQGLQHLVDVCAAARAQAVAA
ncbi:hypothetical protein [Methylobacterium sp. 22177]|uniref:hypothetical protein n=1 Tax=Methylobacterium sp. 22177 TaxID=3453885 RepID=UPI003F82A07B